MKAIIKWFYGHTGIDLMWRILIFIIILSVVVILSLMLNFPITFIINWLLVKLGANFILTYWQIYWGLIILNILIGGRSSNG